MPRFLDIACGLSLALAACAKPTVPVIVPPVADPCPSEGLAPLRVEPIDPLPDTVEKGRVFGAIAQVLGPDRAQSVIRFWETEVPTWGRQGWERVGRTKTWCENR